MAKKKKAVSDGHLMKLWREAVLKEHGKNCWFCRKSGDVECHHIVHRKHFLLRWDWRNGIPVCHKCHANLADRLEGREIIQERHIYFIYLKEMERIMKKDYLLKMEMTDDEFRLKKLKELKEKIKE